MSIQLINQYYASVEKIIRYGGSYNEGSLRKPFQDLLEQYARAKNLVVVAEVELTSKRGTRIRPDGVLKDALRQDWGFWESKDEKDDIEAEIATKFAKGYPNFNILFEDTHQAILYQSGERAMSASFADAIALDALLTRFVSYEPREVVEFHKAIQLFSEEVGGLAEVLRRVIDEQVLSNGAFQAALTEFLELCKKSINPKIEMADVREMVIQHVLTEDIFMRVFDEAEFHRENVIAHKLAQVAGTFYSGDTKRNIHARIAPYYETINARASQISDHHEKQKFLKALYESFYKAYNPKAADRLGIVYTPDEIVRFMIESANHLTWQHFGKGLGERGVEILDPATGTGTFITELIEYLPPAQLEYKYLHEIHCNEVSILPYYIANLNIEYTYKQKTGKYQEFENICFVDTLDNMGFEHTGQQLNFFGLTDENAERITRQNSKPIMVVIGNPPYNANQANENENNKNREYPEIDRRIKDTYIKQSTAQKTKLYDMYARFYRWASDRLDKNGIIALITNSSFLDLRTFDGFRKIVADEFSYIYIVDLGGNVRKNPKLSGTIHNVFGIQAGVCIAFLVKIEKKSKSPIQIFYTRRPELEPATEKLEFLRSVKFSDIQFEYIHPDKNNNWLNLTENDWGDLIPLIIKETKTGTEREQRAVFKLFSAGAVTARDEWIYDFSSIELEKKVTYFSKLFNDERLRWETSDKNTSTNNFVNRGIKWTSELEAYMLKGSILSFSPNRVVTALYRPFVKQNLYYEKVFVHRTYQLPNLFPNKDAKNFTIAINYQTPVFACLATESAFDYALLKFGNGSTQCLPLYRFIAGERVENISDWALEQFRAHYGPHPLTPSPKSGEGEKAPLHHCVVKGPGDEVVLAQEPQNKVRSAPADLWQKLKPLAREMRHQPTQAENHLWQLLRNRQIKNAKFRRQHAIDRFIVDFYCAEYNLVVEVDGPIHQYQAEEDAIRQAYLESQGLRVLRFNNDEVIHQTPTVLNQITASLTPLRRAVEKGPGDEVALPNVENRPGDEVSLPALANRPMEEVEITKTDIFHYVYAVLHHPAYRAKYEQNLKREFPRIPFYEDFWQWAHWGQRLMELHLNYETLAPFELERVEKDQTSVTPRLIARKDTGIIEVDTITSLHGVPVEAWDYRLGTYSALEWVLERYKEKKPKDPTIAEKFNTYKFANYKEQVIELLGKVCRVSVETMQIIKEMPE